MLGQSIKLTLVMVILGSSQTYAFTPKYKTGRPEILCSYQPNNSIFDFPSVLYTVEISASGKRTTLHIVDRSRVVPENPSPGAVVMPITKNELVYETAVVATNDGYKGKDVVLSLYAPDNTFDNEFKGEVTHAVFKGKVPLACKGFVRFDPNEQVDAIQQCYLRDKQRDRTFETTFYRNQSGKIVAEVLERSFAGRHEVGSVEVDKFNVKRHTDNEIAEIKFAASRKNNLSLKGSVDYDSIDNNRGYLASQAIRLYEPQFDKPSDSYKRQELIVSGDATCESYIQLPANTNTLHVFMTGRGPVVDDASLDRLRVALKKLSKQGLIDHISDEQPTGGEGGSSWDLHFSGSDMRVRLHKVYNALKTIEYDRPSTDFQVWDQAN